MKTAAPRDALSTLAILFVIKLPYGLCATALGDYEPRANNRADSPIGDADTNEQKIANHRR